MSLFNELRQLEQLHERGTLTQEELERAKVELLGGASEHDSGDRALFLEQAIADEHSPGQDDLAHIDRQWEIESYRYLITGRGESYFPTKGGALLQMAAGVTFGICWIVVDCWLMSSGRVGVTIFTFLGPIIALFAIGQGLYFLYKARQYKAAEGAYQKRRAAAIERNWAG
jgi:hypothetical protein